MADMGSAKYILNFDEWELGLENIKVDGLEDLDEIKKLLEDYFEQIIDLLKQLIKPYNCVKTIDFSMHIPAIVKDFYKTVTLEDDAYITGITFSQTAWKCEDTITMTVGDKVIIDHIHTKELGQSKTFKAFIKVPAGTEVNIIHNNDSGNSKMFFCDLTYAYKIGNKEETENEENEDDEDNKDEGNDSTHGNYGDYDNENENEDKDLEYDS